MRSYQISIFTSWFQLICGSQRSQLEFVLWWCGLEQLHYQRQRNGAFPRLWWAQYGAPPHRYRPVHARLQTLFPNRVIGLGHDPEWPARSPDLNPLDFFLRGYLKARVYRTLPTSPQDLESELKSEPYGDKEEWSVVALETWRAEQGGVSTAKGDRLKDAQGANDQKELEIGQVKKRTVSWL